MLLLLGKKSWSEITERRKSSSQLATWLYDCERLIAVSVKVALVELRCGLSSEMLTACYDAVKYTVDGG